MSDTEKRRVSFKDFVKDETVNEFVVPTNVVGKEEDQEELDAHIPALFATIHFKSEHRPDGYTDEDIEDMNNKANAHLPHLQTKPTA